MIFQKLVNPIILIPQRLRPQQTTLTNLKLINMRRFRKRFRNISKHSIQPSIILGLSKDIDLLIDDIEIPFISNLCRLLYQLSACRSLYHLSLLEFDRIECRLLIHTRTNLLIILYAIRQHESSCL